MELLAPRLRYCLSFLRKHKESSTPVNYHVLQCSQTSVKDLLASSCAVATPNSLQYFILLIRKIILTTFQLLCWSEEVEKDVVYSYGQCKDIFSAVETFNLRFTNGLCGECPSCFYHRKDSLDHCIVFADLLDVYIGARVQHIAAAIDKDYSVKNIVEIARFENGLSMAVIGMVATFTSLQDNAWRRKLTVKERLTFVSEEMFGTNSQTSKSEWMDCFIPGVPTHHLEPICKTVLCRLWSKVAESLVAHNRYLLDGGRTWKELLPHLSTSDLDGFLNAAACVRHVVSVALQEKCLLQWDNAFQKVLLDSSALYRKGFKKLPSRLHEMKVLGAEGFLALERHRIGLLVEKLNDMDKEEDISLHVDIMKQSLLPCAALQALTDHVAFILVQSIGKNLAKWNFTNITWLMSTCVPLTQETIRKSEALMQCVSSPRVSFMNHSSLHTLECLSRSGCISLHSVVMHLQEIVKNFYKCFQQLWEENCRRILHLHFPTMKYWTNLRNRKGMYETKPSGYCEVILTNLFSPMVDSITELSEEQEGNMLYLFVVVFYQVLRKTVVSNKKLHEPAIRSQLLFDHHYLLQWLRDRNLRESSRHLLSSIPILVDFEKELSDVCNATTSGLEHSDGAVALLSVSLPHNYYPIFKEIAWNSEKDWL